jgi:hypothetical protein
MRETKICVNAMVGNEQATITRMLQSVADYVDYYVIQCNGNDNTKQIIDEFFESRGIPGFTYEIGWEYPGWNRDHTLQTALKADHGCDWILRMDADEQLVVDEDFDWSIFNNTNVESWNIPADAGDTIYFRTWMWNAKLPWYFAHDKRHETIWLPDVGEGFERVNLPKSFRQVITNDGDTWLAPMKFITDGLTLELDKVPSKKVLEDPYHLFYIGKSYSDGYRDLDQLPFGKEHSDEYARRVIFYFKMYLDQLHNWSETQTPNEEDDMGYYALLLMGDAYGWLGDYDAQEKSYVQAGMFAPKRNEHYISLAYYYQNGEEYDKMLEVTSILMNPVRVNPFPESSFLILNDAYWDTGNLCNELHLRAIQYVRGK